MKANRSKRLAIKLVDHAVFVLPRSLSSWGAAMRNEMEYIHSDREALKWAIGCVSSSYWQRLASLNVVNIAVIRCSLALFIASWAAGDVIAARAGYLKLSQWLGLDATGAYSAASITALRGVPTGFSLLEVTGGLLYIIAAYWLMRRKAKSLQVLIGGATLNAVACLSPVILAYLGYGPRLSGLDLIRICAAYAPQIGVILLLWHGFHSVGEARCSD